VQRLQEIEVFDTKPGQLQPPLASEDNSPALLSFMLVFSFCAYLQSSTKKFRARIA
jgi:hypothetical protein